MILVVSGDDIPGGVWRAGRFKALAIGFRVLLPEVPLRNVRETEFPVLCRFIDACQEAFALFFLGDVEEELDYACFIAVEMLLRLDNRAIPLVPNRLRVGWYGNTFDAKHFRMNAHDKYVLVVASIEDSDHSP